MKSDKPLKLIGLLNNLKNESDKSKYKSIYSNIANETISLEFELNSKEPFQGIVYKKLIQATVKEYVHLGQTEEALSNIDWLIDFLDSTTILTR